MELAHEDVQAWRRHRVLGHAGPAQRETLDHRVGVEAGAVAAVDHDVQPGVQPAALQAKRTVAGQVERGQPQVEITHVDVRARVQRSELHIVRPDGHEGAGDVRKGDGGAAPAPGGEAAAVESDVVGAPRPGRLQQPVLEGHLAVAEGEVVDRHVEPRARGRRPVEQVGDVESTGADPHDARLDAAHREVLDPQLAVEQRPRPEGGLEATDLGEHAAIVVGDAQAAQAEAAVGQAEVQRRDRHRAPRGRLQLPQHRPTHQGRELEQRGRRHRRDDQEHDGQGEPESAAPGHCPQHAKAPGRVRVTCSPPLPTGILAAMTNDPIDLETLRRGARLAGFTWSDAELEEIRPQVEATLRMLRALDTVAVGDAEPTTLYRTV